MEENYQPTGNADPQAETGDQAPVGGGGQTGGDDLPFKCKIRVKRGKEWAEVDSDADFYGNISADILDARVEIAFGQNKEMTACDNIASTFEKLLEKISRFERGPKDGTCMLQGAVAVNHGQRVATNQRENYILMLDHDTGETVDEITAKIRQRGWFSIVWTTHSHMGMRTEIAQKALTPWRQKRGASGPVTNRELADYLMEVRRVKPAIFENLASPDGEAKARQLATGVTYTLEHAPITKARSLYMLKESFTFASRNGGTQQQAIAEWKERYAGVSEHLGLAFDTSCTDPSRLMFLPRISATAQIAAGAHEIRVIPGDKLDLDAIPRVSARAGRVAGDPISAFERDGDKSGRGHEFKTKNVPKFLAVAGNDFEASDWAQSVGVEPRHVHADGMDCACPNEDGHTTPKSDDRAFSIRNASGNTAGTGFSAWCLHDGCKTASQGDRAWYLDMLCQQASVVDAMDLISPEYTPEVWKVQEAEKAKQKADREDLASKIADKVAALTRGSTVDDVQEVLRLIAKRPAGLQDEDDLQTIQKQTGRGTKTLRTQISHYRKELAGEKVNKRAGDGREAPPAAPVPDDLGEAAWIWTNWGHNVVVEAALARLGRLNEGDDPTLFVVDDKGGVGRVETLNGRKAITTMHEKEWRGTLSKKIVFKQRMPTGDVRSVAADRSTLHAIMGSEDKPFPVLERMVHVPVFAADGTIRWERGYVPEMLTYLDPDKVEWLPVSERPTAKEVSEAVWWIEEAFRDFPFTDVFDGSDRLPVKDGGSDVAGYREPNWARGACSRAHAYAMVIQHFARNLIGGPCPFYHIDKAAPGEGAGYLMNVVNIITDGQPAVARPLSPNAEEVRKAITAAALGKRSVNFFDNINHKVDCGPLAASATAGKWQDRILGKSEDSPEIPMRGIWCFAGNNVKLTHELMRRMVPIRLDSATPRPEDRPPETFKHFPLSDWVLRHRPELVWACHTIIQNWVAHGMSPGAGHLASFDGYARTMSGILECAGIEGFLCNIPSYMSHGKDADDDTAAAVIVELFRRHGWDGGKDGQGFTPDDVSDVMTTLGDGFAIPFQAQGDPGWANRKICTWIDPLTRRTFAVSPVDPFSAMGQPVDPFRAPKVDFAGNVKLVRIWNKPARFKFFPVAD